MIFVLVHTLFNPEITIYCFLFFIVISCWKKKNLLKTCFTNVLKCQCHEIFWQFLMGKPTWAGPLINRLKWFCWKKFFKEIFALYISSKISTPQSLSIISRISSRKLIFQQNQFNLLVKGPSWLDLWNKKLSKNCMTLPLYCK